MNKTKMCLVQMWGGLVLHSYYIPIEVFQIHPILLELIDRCNGEKIHVEFMQPLFAILDQCLQEKMIIHYEMLSGFLPLRSIVVKIVNIQIDTTENQNYTPERVKRLCMISND